MHVCLTYFCFCVRKIACFFLYAASELPACREQLYTRSCGDYQKTSVRRHKLLGGQDPPLLVFDPHAISKLEVSNMAIAAQRRVNMAIASAEAGVFADTFVKF